MSSLAPFTAQLLGASRIKCTDNSDWRKVLQRPFMHVCVGMGMGIVRVTIERDVAAKGMKTEE